MRHLTLKGNYPASDEDKSTRREVPLRGASAIARPTSIPVLVALISTAPIFPLLVSPLIVVVVPFLLTVAMSGPLMRTIARTRGPGDIWVLLLRCRQGSASAFRVLCLREGAQDVVDIAENVGIHILLGQRKGLERRVGDAQDLKTIGHRDQSIGGRELVGSVKAVLVPDEYMIIHDDRLHLLLFVCDHAHTRFVLPNLSSSDLLAGAFDGWKHHVAQNGNPMHTPRCKVLDRTIEGVVGVRSQTL